MKNYISARRYNGPGEWCGLSYGCAYGPWLMGDEIPAPVRETVLEEIWEHDRAAGKVVVGGSIWQWRWQDRTL